MIMLACVSLRPADTNEETVMSEYQFLIKFQDVRRQTYIPTPTVKITTRSQNILGT